MRAGLTALASDRHVLGVYLDDKDVAAWYAEMAELRAVEEQIMRPPNRDGDRFGKPLFQSAIAEKFMMDRAREKMVMFGELYGFKEHHFSQADYSLVDAEVVKKLYDSGIEPLGKFKEMLAHATEVVASVHDEIHVCFDDVAKMTEALNVWKKTEPLGGASPGQGSSEDRA